MFDSDIFACLGTCLCASRQIFPDVLKKGTKKEERERDGGMKDAISQFRSDETSWRISM